MNDDLILIAPTKRVYSRYARTSSQTKIAHVKYDVKFGGETFAVMMYIYAAQII